MTQIQNIVSNKTDNISTNQNDSRASISYDEIVSNLVTQGLPQAFNPNTYLAKIATNYNISKDEARNCLKLAIKELEKERQTRTQTKTVKENNDVPFAQSGYFYPRETTSSLSLKQPIKNDGMDNLNSFGSYNKLMFGIK